MFGKFKEKKANVVTQLHETLDKLFPIVAIDKVRGWDAAYCAYNLSWF